MKSNITYKIYTLGCKVNQYDSGTFKAGLNNAGFCETGQGANIAIVNTCAVTNTAIVKAGRMINIAKKENPGAKLVVVGCWPQSQNKNKYLDIDCNIDLIWGVGETEKLIAKIVKLGGDVKEVNENSKIAPPGPARSRYFLKIQDGCEQFCSYCIIPYTRGKLKSRSGEEVLGEIKEAIKAGYEEIVLCGIHLGLYGREGLRVPSYTKATEGKLKKGEGLVKLLREIIKIKRLERVRLSSIEVMEVSDELIDLIASTNKICNHLHIPLQSGCDKILKLMNRQYDVAHFTKRIEKIRKQIKDVSITTDVIVGFPGESVDDFKTTYDLVKRIKFSRLHVFPFSAHERTQASKYSNQISRSEKKERADKLRSLSYQLAREYKDKFKGLSLTAVVEKIAGNKIFAKSEYYFDIEIKKDQLSKTINTGEIVIVKLE